MKTITFKSFRILRRARLARAKGISANATLWERFISRFHYMWHNAVGLNIKFNPVWLYLRALRKTYRESTLRFSFHSRIPAKKTSSLLRKPQIYSFCQKVSTTKNANWRLSWSFCHYEWQNLAAFVQQWQTLVGLGPGFAPRFAQIRWVCIARQSE